MIKLELQGNGVCLESCAAAVSPSFNWNALEAIGTTLAALIAAIAIWNSSRLNKARSDRHRDAQHDAAGVLGIGISEELTVLRAMLLAIADLAGGPPEKNGQKLYEAIIGLSVLQPVLLRRAAMRLHVFGPTLGGLLMAILSSVGRLNPSRETIEVYATLPPDVAKEQLDQLARNAVMIVQTIDSAVPLLGKFTTRSLRIAPRDQRTG